MSYPPPPSGRHSSASTRGATASAGGGSMRRGAESPASAYSYGSLDRRRRLSGSAAQQHQQHQQHLLQHQHGVPARPASSSSSRRVSPGPSIYRTMPLSPQNGAAVAAGRITPGSAARTPQLVRPVPQRMGHPAQQPQQQQPQQPYGAYPGVVGGNMPRTFSPVTVPKISQSPVSENPR